MQDFNLENIVRANIKTLQPYSSARTEYTGDALIFLDANENSYGSPLDDLPSPVGEGQGVRFNRYPDPLQSDLKKPFKRKEKFEEIDEKK